MNKCPTCRRNIDPLQSDCPRCNTDLTLIQRLDDEFNAALANGDLALAQNEPATAEKWFNHARRIRSDSNEPYRGLAIAALLKNDYAKALTLHKNLNP
jgi:hypothetical protein